MPTPTRTIDAFGWHEGRDPNAFFSTGIYLSANPDVKAAGVDPLAHFDRVRLAGRPRAFARLRSARSISPPIRTSRPRTSIRCGISCSSAPARGASRSRRRAADRRRTASTMSITCSTIPTSRRRGVDPLQHFQTFGWQEGRNPNALFDVNGYLATYADVAAAGVNPLDHYNTFGWHEGRDPSVEFDTTSYLAAYPDVAAAGSNPLSHYLTTGLAEGRYAFADGVWG